MLVRLVLDASYRFHLRAGHDQLEFMYFKGSRELNYLRIATRSNHFMPPDLLDSPLASLEGPTNEVSFEVPTTNGEDFRVIDYASAGNTWDKASEYVTWIPTPLDSPVPTQPFAPSPVVVN